MICRDLLLFKERAVSLIGELEWPFPREPFEDSSCCRAAFVPACKRALSRFPGNIMELLQGFENLEEFSQLVNADSSAGQVLSAGVATLSHLLQQADVTLDLVRCSSPSSLYCFALCSLVVVVLLFDGTWRALFEQTSFARVCKLAVCVCLGVVPRVLR